MARKENFISKQKPLRTRNDPSLKNRLWNAISRHYFPYEDLTTALGKSNLYYYFIYNLYDVCFREDADIVNDNRSKDIRYFRDQIKDKFYRLNHKGICDFLEFVVDNAHLAGVEGVEIKKFIEKCNTIFNVENTNYHFLDCKIVQIDFQEQIKEIDDASRSPYPTINQHFITAWEFLNNERNPSYRNSVKESISAIESLIKMITNQPNRQFSDLVKIMIRDHHLNAVLMEALKKIFGYTSSANGIRHALTESSNVDKDEARFIFIVSIAFINYILRKLNKIN